MRDRVFPAHAGMSHDRARKGARGVRFPRPRGDEPRASMLTGVRAGFSPPTRG